jgi:Tfp pilus assembly protein PilO
VTDGLKSWLHDNQTLVYFLLAQAVAIGAAVLSITAYMVRLETRVATLETRGSPHLAVIDNRLTVLEKATENNKQSIDRVVEIMLRELPLKKDGTAR